jgi:hypothetical protein
LADVDEALYPGKEDALKKKTKLFYEHIIVMQGYTL